MKIYKCRICGNVVMKLEDMNESLNCCGKPMELLEANTNDGAVEKHLPVYEIKENKINIKVGEIDHPMTEEHYIKFIILSSKDEYMIKTLTPTEQATAIFPYDKKYTKIYAYCNLHDLWVTEIK